MSNQTDPSSRSYSDLKMKKHPLFWSFMIIFLAFAVGATPALAGLPNPGTIIPIPKGSYAKYTGKPHKSGFPASWKIVNPGQKNSSIDLGYSGTVVSPLAGKVDIIKDCGDEQVAFVRGADGWAIGLVHIYVNKDIRNENVQQGQVIGKTVPPKPYPGKGCGYGKGNHIHYTLMRWEMTSSGPRFTEQGIVNSYISKWIVKDTYLDGPKYGDPSGDVPLGGTIK